MIRPQPIFSFFFFNDTATTEIYTLSLHDALPIYDEGVEYGSDFGHLLPLHLRHLPDALRDHQFRACVRSEEDTSELQSPDHLVCRLLLEKKKNMIHLSVTI